MDSIGSRIKSAREMKGWTQAELASRLGINRVSVTQWEGDQTKPSANKYESIAELLGGSADWYLSGKGIVPVSDALLRNLAQQKSDSASQNNPQIEATARSYGPGSTPPFPRAHDMPNDIPVLGTAAGSHIKGAFKLGSDVIDYVRRPPGLSGTKDVYALYVEGSSMEPQYFPGDLIFVNPRRPPRVGDIVVVQVKESEEGVEGSIGVYVRRTERSIVLGKRNPATEIEIPRHDGVVVHKVLSNNELFGI